jgi:hypothetical protein
MAIETAKTRREQGKDRFIWTTGSWLIYEYLEQASPEERKSMEQAIAAGDIAWHALPFSWQTEMLDRSSIQGCLGFSKTLDARFGRNTIAGKMTDVPGHSRGIIAPLAEGGIRLLDIGVNPGSSAPEVPDAFLWKDPQGASIAMLYHRHSYGSVIQIPGTDLAVDVEMRGDNEGPHKPEEIDAIYRRLHQQFPNAKISAADLSGIAIALEPARASLPVVTGEIGDTWIYGVPSDPPKIAKYRELSRLRNEWLTAGRFSIGDETDRQLLRRLTLAVEHTWGTDPKHHLDYDSYAPADLAQKLDAPEYKFMELTWQEKRDDITQGIRSLPTPLRTEAEARIQKFAVQLPSTSGMRKADANHVLRTSCLEVALDPKTGAIQRLTNVKTGKAWASPDHPLALFSYQTLSQDDYTKFTDSYLTTKAEWATQDFGKPGVGRFKPQSRSWEPVLRDVHVENMGSQHRLVATLAIEDAAAEQRGLVRWPTRMYLEVILAKEDPTVALTFYSMGKAVNRMPEAMWLSFKPQTSAPPDWTITKVGEQVPVMDVIRGGSRCMHAVTDTFTVRDGEHQLSINTMDAPVLAVGLASPINFSRQQPDLTKGVHVSLFNNAWGTNYPQWAGGDWMYRFTLKA